VSPLRGLVVDVFLCYRKLKHTVNKVSSLREVLWQVVNFASLYPFPQELIVYSLSFIVRLPVRQRNTPVSFRGEYYIRIGSYKKRLDDHPERERKIWHIEKQFVFENEIAKENVSEDEVLQLIDYPKFFELLKLPLPDNRKGILDRMLQENIIVKHEQRYNIKNIGALLFAKNLDDFYNIARKAVRVIFYDGVNRIKTIKEQLGQKGYAAGFEGLIKYLDDNLPSNEIIDKALRERFGIEEHNYTMASKIISDTIKSGLIKDYDSENNSKKYAKYVPCWF
jgi:predicted HTH transcriptional regulator